MKLRVLVAPIHTIAENQIMLVCGIETSCDETSVAILECDDDSNHMEIRVNLISSQLDAHALFGGVVPEIASRKHLEIINPLLEAAREEAKISWRDLDLVCVTRAPGLVGALLVGVAAGKALSFAHSIPIQPVNHVEGHIASNFLASPDLKFPMLCLVVSGGHSDLVLMTDFNSFQRLGKTRDDAVGEAFDKVARVLQIPQPGGPNLEKAAREGNADTFPFTVSNLEPSLDFSYSGLKTAASQTQKKFPNQVENIAASFQRAAIAQLERNVRRAVVEYSAQTLGICGGVAANGALREIMENAAREMNVDFTMPDKILCTDNAAMIAAAGWFRFRALPASAWEYSRAQLSFDTQSVSPVG